jgi:hypothetical protein
MIDVLGSKNEGHVWLRFFIVLLGRECQGGACSCTFSSCASLAIVVLAGIGKVVDRKVLHDRGGNCNMHAALYFSQCGVVQSRDN